MTQQIDDIYVVFDVFELDNNRELTRARIYDSPGAYFFWGEGFAVQHPKDKPDREKGIKIALNRAFKAAGFDKESRRKLWNAFLPDKLNEVLKTLAENQTENQSKPDITTKNQSNTRANDLVKELFRLSNCMKKFLTELNTILKD